MTDAVETLSELSRRGVTIRVEGGTLRLRPKSALDDTLLARVRQAKPELLMALRNRPATCAETCYEIEPGRWIHHPWDGCKTIVPRPPKAAQEAEQPCWHCGGKGECNCIECGLYKARMEWAAGPCLSCEARKRQREQ